MCWKSAGGPDKCRWWKEPTRWADCEREVIRKELDRGYTEYQF